MRIFISHIHEENEIAKIIKNSLVDSFGEQINVFLSEEIQLGVNWFQEIKDALNSADVILVLFSHYSVHREWINIEAGYGIMNNKTVIPICCCGFKKSQLPIVYALYQAIEVTKVAELKTLFMEISNYTPAKKFLGNIDDVSGNLHLKISQIQFKDFYYNTIIGQAPTIWVIGSHRVENMYEREKVVEVAEVISSAFSEEGFQIVMGSSSILNYIGCKTSDIMFQLDNEDNRMTSKIAKSSAIANLNKPSPNPVMLLGSLLSPQGVKHIFYDSIGKIPDMAILIGGHLKGRVMQEYEKAIEADIPVLSIKFTGGIAGNINSTVNQKFEEEEKTIQNLSNQMAQFKIDLVDLIKKQVMYSRENNS
ncbi:MAG: toll/interleukin-1 receptor domain-containing protein [Candidatus Woesearchaeota archaeon]